MESVFKEVASYVSLLCEFFAVLCVAVGALKAALMCLRPLLSDSPGGAYKPAWIALAAWLMLALEFALAADIADTAIAPNWTEIGQLAAIAAIRTVLNFFLARDIETLAEPARSETVTPAA